MMTMLIRMAMFLEIKGRELLTDEEGEVNIVAIVVLIGIAVLLAIVFHEQIGKLLESLFATIGENATKAIGGDGD